MVFVLTKYVLKRLAYIVVVFFIVSFLMYCLFSLIPSDPARTRLEPMKQKLKPEVYEQMYQELRDKMGLDDPIVLRYLRWMGLAPDKESGEVNILAIPRCVKRMPLTSSKRQWEIQFSST